MKLVNYIQKLQQNSSYTSIVNECTHHGQEKPDTYIERWRTQSQADVKLSLTRTTHHTDWGTPSPTRNDPMSTFFEL